jgi:threonine dehydratase
MNVSNVTLKDVYQARKRIHYHARKTSLILSPKLSDILKANVFLKLENTQETNSFKIRGAANKLLSLNSEELKKGVISVSTGNHGRAISYIANKLGVKSVVCVSEHTTKNKIRELEQLGSEVIVRGKGFDDAEKIFIKLSKELGLTSITSDDPYIIAGHATIGIEILEELSEIDTILVPNAAGGLVGGIGLVLKSADSKIKVIGVCSEKTSYIYECLKAGKLIKNVKEEEDTLADAMAGGINPNNKYTFRMCQLYSEETIMVPEEAIAEAMAFALDKHQIVVEGAGAVGIAAILSRTLQNYGKNIVIVISGGNVDLTKLFQIFEAYKANQH